MAQSHTLAALHQLRCLGDELARDVLTLHIGAETPGLMTPKNLMSQFHSLRHSSLSAMQKEVSAADLNKIESFLTTYQPGTNSSLAIFSSGDQLWESLEFEFPLQPYMTYVAQPYLAPIDAALNSHGSYVVLLINKKRARLLSVNMGEVTDDMEITNPEPLHDVKLLRNEGLLGGQDKAFRHTQKYLMQYLKMVARAAAEFAGRVNAPYVIIGGHKEMLGKFKALLPARLKSKVRGEMIALPDMPTPIIIQKTQLVIQSFTSTDVEVPRAVVV